MRVSPYIAVSASLLAASLVLLASPPAWWSTGSPPVIVVSAEQNNSGVANVGQAKYMAKRALDALRAVQPAVAEEIEQELVGSGKPLASWNSPTTEEQHLKQYEPLLLGQLKAISAPFYTKLHAVAPEWLEGELTANQTKDPSNSANYFPWTSTAADDANHSPAVIGQLKAVFSLRFETLVLANQGSDDPDGDGLTNSAEASLGTSAEDADTDGDGIPDGADSAPLVAATVPLAAATTLMVWQPLD